MCDQHPRDEQMKLWQVGQPHPYLPEHLIMEPMFLLYLTEMTIQISTLDYAKGS